MYSVSIVSNSNVVSVLSVKVMYNSVSIVSNSDEQCQYC